MSVGVILKYKYGEKKSFEIIEFYIVFGTSCFNDADRIIGYGQSERRIY